MAVKGFSARYLVRALSDDDVSSVYELCRQNPLYYQYFPPFVSEELIRKDMVALPPGKTMKDKHYVGYFSGSRLRAVMDLISSYPDERTDFIGFFMVDHSCQGKGVGSDIIRELCGCLRARGRRAIRLGWVQGNPQAEHFWKKNGFEETGGLSRSEDYTIVIAEKRLDR